METYLFHIFIPMIISNVLHMVLVKRDALPSLAVPIATKLFGPNKTWRGVIFVTLSNGIFFWLVNLFLPLFEPLQAFSFGAFLGTVYMLFELPNSWFKRRMGIASGQKATKNAWFYMLLDKMDSAIGVCLACKFLFELTWAGTLQLFLLSVLLHISFSWLLVALGVKKRF